MPEPAYLAEKSNPAGPDDKDQDGSESFSKARPVSSCLGVAAIGNIHEV